MSLLLVYATALACLVCVDANLCVISQCNCNDRIGIIDCSGVGLYSVAYHALNIGNYSQLLLRNNYLEHFNVSLVMALLPTVTVIDLRDNYPVLCRDLTKQTPPDEMIIISDCHVATVSPPTSEWIKNRTVQLSNPHATSSRLISDRSNQHPTLQVIKSEESTTTLEYIYAIVIALLIIPALLITIHSITRCWKTRRQFIDPEPHMSFQLSPLNAYPDSDSEENIIFTQANTAV